jgi:hypothetical protein
VETNLQTFGIAMNKIFSLCLLLCITAVPGLAAAEQVTKEQIKGLDKQVQEIKKDVLAISAELNQLEEKLLYPSNTHVSFFVSLEKGTNFEPGAVQLTLDSKDVAHYIYSFKELEALQQGGVQRVFTGNLTTGEHSLQVKVIGKESGSKTTDSADHKLTKGIGPQFVEIRLTGSGIEFRDW